LLLCFRFGHKLPLGQDQTAGAGTLQTCFTRLPHCGHDGGLSIIRTIWSNFVPQCAQEYE
jgi:hypothetical protein